MFDTADIAVAAPPQPTRPAQTGVVTRLLPVAMAGATVAMMAVVFYTRSGIARSPVFVAFPLMMLISAVVSAIAGRDRWRTDLDGDRADYLDYLSDLRGTVVKTAAAQRVSLNWQHPEPYALWTLVGSSRMWERRPADPDFCCVRIGTGRQQLATRLLPPQLPAGNRVDPVTVTALRRFLQAHQTIRDLPVALDLREIGTVTIVGDKYDARGLLRAMICQLAVMHSPSRLLLVGAIDDCEWAHWDWLKWLPHHQHPKAADDVGPARMVYPTLRAAEKAIAEVQLEHRPQAVVVVDSGGVVGLTMADAARNISSGAWLRVSAEQLTIGDDTIARPDRMDQAAATACAQRMAAYHAADAGASPGDTPPWQQLLSIGELAAFTPTALWDRSSRRDRLRVPIGTTFDGAPLELDIKEAAENGMGPHGLCVGATGSGKSELLRTIALGMMVRHSPEALNLVLVDFKGGATFLGLEKSPHVAAVITNLSDEVPLVARMREALTGEMNRRQELLRAAGNLDNISAYQHARHTGARLPTLFIIVDEFSELLSQHPDFAEVFVAIGRLGRSLGMHLLLASQRLDEGRLRGLESHLSYRICLKTLSANESRIVLGTSDAYELPNTPGVGYLRGTTSEPIPFRGAYVSGPCPTTARPTPHCTKTAPVRRFTIVPVGRVRLSPHTSDANGQRTVLQTVVDRLSGFGPRAHEVWLPPLGAAPELDAVLRDFATTGVLTVPIGIVDRPFEQRRTPLTVELAGAAGNVGVIGAPQSGKSTALRTLITALAATHDPSQVQFYCLDFGGGALTSLRCLPHVGVVAGRAEADLVARTIAELESLLMARATGCRDRSHHFGDDVFLVVDGWAALPTDYQAQITALAAQGLSFGIHVVVSASRWAELRPALKDQIGTRIELRLGDPADSELDRRRAQQVPEGRPGRGLSRDGQHMVIALPSTEICRRGTTTAPPIPVLPTRVDLTGLELSDRIVLGLEERQLAPATVDFDGDGHLLILGDIECGKTATLRTLCREIVRTASAAQVRLFIVDFRRTLLGVVESDHLGGYAASAAAHGVVLPVLLDMLRRRMPPLDITQTQLRERSWWSGPDIYVVVDDYEVVAAVASNPLAPILEYLPHARDLGLHLVVARRSGGAARALFDPLLAELRDSGGMGLMMSASPDDGPLIGSVRPVPLPPGRGTLITRGGGHQLVQVAWSPPP
ncbi:type VII secretion protein EccC [Mycobacterium branderi]|uniref:Type VII secretion protein EccC n=2 Tax=Mycobacterium branderi TaxID=43348 RepID=A0A7I7VYG1_9MYCO|nr:type VII secretion protein EccCa [Mycobacterium branderi]ORA41764.1 type VII secretion protein EccC [Mycobacterium branderi]BBZ10356.1 type VII secretion protein EccC [Mycobacterium branderi]